MGKLFLLYYLRTMGCTHLCDKKTQKIGDFKNKKDNTHTDPLLININDPDNLSPLLNNEHEKENLQIDLYNKKTQEIDESNKINNTQDDVVIINIDDPNNLKFFLLNSSIGAKIYEDHIFLLGQNFLNYKEFLNVYDSIFQLTYELPTTFYTLSFNEVKKIIEDLKTDVNPPIISDKLYSFVINNKNKIIECSNSENIYKSFSELFLDNTDFQKEIIISNLKYVMRSPNFTDNNISCALIKLFQDIGFCIRILFYTLKSIVLKDNYCYEFDFDRRILFFLNLIENLCYEKKFPSDLLEFATESSRVKDTIILGDKQFRKNIKDLNLPCERINDLDDNILDLFFKKPFKINGKYKVVKYFVICEEKDFENKYLEEFKNLSSKYGFAYLFLVYVKNKKIIEIRNDLREQNSLIYFFDKNELIEIYKDNNERLRPRLREFLTENITPFRIELNKINEEFVYNNLQDLKSNSEDGWELFGAKKNKYHFNFLFISACFQDFIRHILRSFIDAYKDHNSLEIFFKYYSNYFFLSLQPEFVVNLTAFVKMFLYAYTLEEGDPHKNLYCILNDDLRSSAPEKINRYLELIKVIGGLIKTKKIKSFTGNVYRASFLKEGLIKNIKIGETIINSAFWSSSKKESVAKKFLKSGHKNALIVTKGELINNIDIHLEEISKYPNEEEVLFLPFCNFKVISFEKINENNFSYYKLVLESVSNTSLVEPYIKMHINRMNCENNENEDKNEVEDNAFVIKFNID